MKKTLFHIIGIALLLAVVVKPVGSAPSVIHAGKRDVVIIGAGLTGLMIGHSLNELPYSYVILEGSAVVGGRVSTLEYRIDGEVVLANEGLEEFWLGNVYVDLAKKLGLRVNQDDAFSSMIIDGKLHVFKPGESKMEFVARAASANELSELFAIEQKMSSHFLRGLRESTVLAREFRHLKHVSFKDWVVAQTGSRFVREWIRICIEPEMATEWDKISAVEGFFEYEKFIGEKGLPNFHINNGTQALTDELASLVGNSRIVTEAKVKKIINGQKNIRVQYTNAHGDIFEIEAKHVVSTVPALNLLGHVEIVPPVSPQRKMAIETMARGHYMKAHLLFKEEAKKYWLSSDGHSMLPILTDSSLGVIYSGNPDRTSKSKTQVLTLLFYGEQAQEYSKLGSDEIRARMVADLDRFFPGIKEYLIDATVQRRFTPISIASWPVGRARNDYLAELLRRAEGRLTISGDFTQSTHSEGAGQAALRALEQIKLSLGGESCSDYLKAK